jgi:hypothetical protein
MSEDSILLDIVQEREIGLITVFITSSLMVIMCAHEELIRPNEAALFFKQPYRSCLESTYCSQCCHRYFYLGLYNKLNSHVQASPSADA